MVRHTLLLISILISGCMLHAKKRDIFVAIMPQKKIQQDVEQIQKALSKSWSKHKKSVNFQNPHDLHITLQMIGNVSDPKNKHYISQGDLEKVIKAVENAATRLRKKDPKFHLTEDKIGGAEFQVKSDHARFVIKRSNRLTNLVNTIRENLEKVPYKKERMDFPDNGHMTIARLKGKLPSPKGLSLKNQDFPVNKLVILQSVYEEERRYKPIAEFTIS